MNAPADFPKALRTFAEDQTAPDSAISINSDFVLGNAISYKLLVVESIIDITISDTKFIEVGESFRVFVKDGRATVKAGSGVRVEPAGYLEIQKGQELTLYKVAPDLWVVPRPAGVYVIPDGVPLPPTLTLNGWQLSWNQTSGSAGAATDYRVTVVPNDGITVTTSGTTANISNPTPFTDYSFSVEAKNAKGWGPASNVVTSQFNLPPAAATLSCTGRRTVQVNGYNPIYVYEAWQGNTKVGAVDGTGKITLPSDNVDYQIRMKSAPNASIWHTTTFKFKPHQYTTDTRHEQCSSDGCGGHPNCAPGCGPTCASGCCPHCGCCVHLYCHRCWTAGEAPKLINEPGYTNVGGNWFKSPV